VLLVFLYPTDVTLVSAHARRFLGESENIEQPVFTDRKRTCQPNLSCIELGLSAIIDDEQERMIALELGGFHGPGRPVCEEDCGRRCCAALLVHLDLGHVLGVTDGDRLGGQIVKGGDGLVKHFAESHFGKDLMKRSESVRLKLN